MEQAGGGDAGDWGRPTRVVWSGQRQPVAATRQQSCLGLVVQQQLHSQWCWSAASLGVATHYAAATPWTQCTIVNAEFTLQSCCQNGSTPQCNKPWYLHKALLRVGHFDSSLSGTLSFAQVQQQIGQRRPICARIQWSGGGGHFVTINCWYTSFMAPGDQYLQIADSLYGTSTYEYSQFATAYRVRGTWSHWYKTRP